MRFFEILGGEGTMPYFKRKTYAETSLASNKSAKSQAGSTPEFENSILLVADAVLAEETHPGPKVDGPFHVRRPIAPNETGEMTLCYSNAPSDGPIDISLSCAQLTTESGDRISGDNVRIEPSRLHIPPGGSEDVKIMISAPREAHEGLYSGKLVGSGDTIIISEIVCEIGGRDNTS